MGIQREDGGVWRGSGLYRRDLRIWGLWLEERSGVLRGLDICGEDTNEYIERISEKKIEAYGSQLDSPQGLLGQVAPPQTYPAESKFKSQRLQD